MKLRMKVTPPNGSPFDFVAARPVVAIGRDPEADLSFTDALDNVSWEHAKIKVSDHAATLLDLDSTNGTFLNGSPTRLKSVALKTGDEFQLGKTGPKFRVLELALNNQPLAETPARVKSATVARPETPIRNGAALQSAGNVSHTRALLIETQTSNRRLMTLLAALFFTLILLIAGAVWLIDIRGRSTDESVRNVEKTVDQQGNILDKTKKQIDNIAADVKTLAQNFDDNNKRNEELRKDDLKRIDQASIDARKMNQEMLEEIRRKQAQGQAVPAGERPVDDLNALNRARGGRTADDPAEPPLELKPGMVISIRKRGSANTKGVDYENAALAAATGDALFLHSLNENKPTKIPVEEIETLFVKNQMYTFNPSTSQFEPGLAFFRLDKSSGMFMRVPRQDVDLSVSERGIIEGETSTQCFVSRSSGMSLVLPKARFGSMTFEAKVIETITTNFGVYTWYEPDREYKFKTHTLIAKEINDDREKKAKEMRDEDYKKKVERYKLATDRLKALRPYWWSWWR
jgi:pSer/pThr/pTyr-binding forkhead associated (FHA) protein